MSCPHIVWALREGKTRRLTPPERLVLMVLAERANGELECWPSIALLAEDTGLSERTVQLALRVLAKAKLIRIEARFRETSKYHVLRPVEGESPAPSQGESPAPLPQKGESPAPTRVNLTANEGESPAPESPKESPKEESPKESALRAGAAASAPPPPAPIDEIRRLLWVEGKRILRAIAGMGPDATGKAIGKWLNLAEQDHAVVLEALRAAERFQPSGSIMAWMTEAIRHRTTPEMAYDPSKLTGAARVAYDIRRQREALRQQEAAA